MSSYVYLQETNQKAAATELSRDFVGACACVRVRGGKSH